MGYKHQHGRKPGGGLEPISHLAPLARGVAGTGVESMPKTAQEAWMPGNAAGHDRPRKRLPKRGYWPRKAKGEPGA